jgi:8-amino-7-oxononanoate synthase
MQAASGAAAGEVTKLLDSLKSANLFRKRIAIDSAQSSRVVVNGSEVLNFCSNDYLGLSNDPKIKKSFQQAVEKYGVGSAASPLVCGRSTAHVELEEEVAKITGRDKAIIFSSGYLANLAVVATLAPDRGDFVFQDKLNHASMIDSAQLSRAKLIRYPHADHKALKETVHKKGSGRKLILTDSVFSMDGDLAPIRDLAKVAKQEKALLAVDDAHGFGVFGKSGAGVLEHFSLGQTDVPLMMATFGKALGCAGAFLAGPENLIELMVQKARPYIYSTALAPAMAVAATQSLRMLRAEQWRRDHLSALINRFREGAQQAGLSLLNSSSPIQPLLVGTATRALAISEALFRSGILITAIRPPTVPINSSRLRITLSASHSEQDIDVLLKALHVCCVDGN